MQRNKQWYGSKHFTEEEAFANVKPLKIEEPISKSKYDKFYEKIAKYTTTNYEDNF